MELSKDKEMIRFSITDLVRIVRSSAVAPETAIRDTQYAIRDVTGVSTDSRTTKAGDCFFAIAGENFDGHDYVSDAFAKGAACAVVGKELDGDEFADKCLLRVEDTVKALGELAREYRREAGFKVVAITGSAGKTTTRQICYHALSRRFGVHQSPKSFNNKIGLPLTLLGAGPDTEIVVAELGSNHPGEISYLTGIAIPDIAVVTNVHPAHLEGFGDLQTIANEKSSISEGLPPQGVLIINADIDILVETCRAGGAAFVTFGKSDGADYRLSNIRFDGPVSRFTIDGTEVRLPLAGPGNVENALAAWTVCSQFGLTIDDFAQAIKTLPAVSMRSEVLQIGTLTVLSDCYNANPASMKNALDILAKLDPTGTRRLVFICGDMAELGPQTERLHAELGASVPQTGVELLLAVGKLSQITADSAAASAEHDLRTKCFDNTLSACNNLHEFIKDYDIILVKGSRTAGLETAVEKLNELFS
ncbi:MAG: UDP-N-acetylmuramoyl-tripeptide--D-alanyl-D-alanine ligase [Planctomycetes bacterium B3_Pla]|nr:MAG: UDP-N-acetylmuramoyl-tripeptide--D-alanyl-D-alanine ligase [Planctomycetes bacterium B3_Pla]